MDAFAGVKQTIEEKKLIAAGDTVLLGLSGGPDSLCLLHVLSELQKEMGFKLHALHVNHLIRGDEANDDMQWIIGHCKLLRVPLKVVVCDVKEIASAEGISLEEAGRKIRQKALKDKAEKLRSEMKEAGEKGDVLIALAHNRDDQAETVMMRIIRGTGVHGLAAMEYRREDGLIRPLLDVSRKDIEAFCEKLELAPRMDSTNRSLEYTRNKIRHKLIPVLESEFNPNIKESLARLAENAREDDNFITDFARREMPPKAKENDMPLEQLLRMDPAVAKRLVKCMFARVGLTEDIGSVHLAALFKAAESGRSPLTIQFPQNYTAEIAYGRVSFNAPADEYAESSKYFLFHTVLLRSEAPKFSELTANQCILDAEKVAALDRDLSLRTRRPGDYIVPLGMIGSKKISDYFTDKKVPKEERDKTQLICCGRKVLWINGGTVSDDCKVDAKTRFVLFMELHRVIN